MPTPARPRLLVLVGLGAVGVLLGLIGAGVSALERTVGSVTVPWGLLLAVVGIGAAVRGAAWLVGSRRGGAAVLLGWLLPTFALSAVNPGGDVVLTDEPRTYVYLLATFALGLLAASWPLPPGAVEAAVPRPRPLEPTDLPAYDDDHGELQPTLPTDDTAGPAASEPAIERD